MKYYINAMARSIREVSSKLLDHSDVVVDHIIKLYFMPNHSARNHWKKEIAMQINSVDVLKGTNKRPTKNQIFKWTYEEVKFNLQDTGWIAETIKDICYNYSVTITVSPDEASEDLDSICQEYFKWMAEYLSRVGKISTDEIYRKLDELL